MIDSILNFFPDEQQLAFVFIGFVVVMMAIDMAIESIRSTRRSRSFPSRR